MADALLADVENQRFAARAAGVETRQPDRVVGLHAVAGGADGRLVEQRQALQVGQRLHVAQRIEADAGKQPGIIRNMGLGARQQLAQAAQLQRLQFRLGPPLRLLHLLAHRHRGVALHAFVQGKQQARHHLRVQAGLGKGLGVHGWLAIFAVLL